MVCMSTGNVVIWVEFQEKDMWVHGMYEYRKCSSMGGVSGTGHVLTM